MGPTKTLAIQTITSPSSRLSPAHLLLVHPELTLAGDVREAFLNQRTAAIATHDMEPKLRCKHGERIMVVSPTFSVKLELTVVWIFRYG